MGNAGKRRGRLGKEGGGIGLGHLTDRRNAESQILSLYTDFSVILIQFKPAHSVATRGAWLYHGLNTHICQN